MDKKEFYYKEMRSPDPSFIIGFGILEVKHLASDYLAPKIKNFMLFYLFCGQEFSIDLDRLDLYTVDPNSFKLKRIC